jgi:hypothetical protein
MGQLFNCGWNNGLLRDIPRRPHARMAATDRMADAEPGSPDPRFRGERRARGGAARYFVALDADACGSVSRLTLQD